MSNFVEIAGMITSSIQNYQASSLLAKNLKRQERLIFKEGEEDALRQEKIDRRMTQKTAQAYLKSGVSLSGTATEVLGERQKESRNFINAMRASTQARAGVLGGRADMAMSQGRAKLVSTGFKAASEYQKYRGRNNTGGTKLTTLSKQQQAQANSYYAARRKADGN